MGNSTVVTQEPDLRSLIHEIHSHLRTKSALLYQISQLKLKINSKKSYADGTDESSGIENNKEEINQLLMKLQELGRTDMENPLPSFDANSLEEISSLLEEKKNCIEELTSSKEAELELISEKRVKMEENQKILNDLLLKMTSNVSETSVDYKELHLSYLQENEKLQKIIEDLKGKAEFLSNRKKENFRRKTTRRQSVLNSDRINTAAAELRSKYLLKNEIQETIKQSTLEQAGRQAAIEKVRINLLSSNKNTAEEERLIQELTNLKDQILELEWEIQGLTEENLKFIKKKTVSSKYSVDSEKPSEDMIEHSFGSSIASLVNEIEEYKIDQQRNELAEENQKLKQHLSEFFSIRGNFS